MAEYIEREALKKQMNATCRNCDARFDERECGRCSMEWAREIVRTATAADVAPVVHGRWEFDAFTAKYGKPYRCSRCKEEYEDTHNYYPNCGAKMDGNKDEK